MRIAIHQLNFIPWFPYFEKMAQSDIFVFLVHVQFEKNSYINRCKVNGEWWTNPVKHGLIPIIDKQYVGGQSIIGINSQFIYAIARLLDIDVTKIRYDFPTEKKGTERIVELCRVYGANEYLVNPDAVNKYLDEKMLNDNGIKVVPFKSNNKKHVFELFNEIGVQKTKELLNHK